jgi:hypothetical protein
MPNRPSTTSAQSRTSGISSAKLRRRGAGAQRLRRLGRGLAAAGQVQHLDVDPGAARLAATSSASPPLLPGPASTSTGAGRLAAQQLERKSGRAWPARASARPARQLGRGAAFDGADLRHAVEQDSMDSQNDRFIPKTFSPKSARGRIQ